MKRFNSKFIDEYNAIGLINPVSPDEIRKAIKICKKRETCNKTKHYLYECTDPDSECEGEEFLVGANNRSEARRIAIENFKCAKFICEMSDYEAEASGLDEY